MEAEQFNFAIEYFKCVLIAEIHKSIGRYVRSVIDDDQPGISKFFKKAFTRWIFIVIMNGMNPFSDLIIWSDLIVKSDIEYFFKTRPDIVRKEFDWNWLNDSLRKIHNISPDVVPLQTVNVVTHDNHIYLTVIDKPYIISLKQYKLASRRFNLHQNQFIGYLTILVARYVSIGTTNNHCSVPPHVVEFCNIHTELFGSPLNTSIPQYCSPFLDIEKHFGSLGSFFDYEMCSGTYLLNPPYDEVIINKAIGKILREMDTDKEITVITVLPIWDPESKLEVAGMVIRDEEFPIIETIKSSRYTRSHELLRYNEHKFYNFYVDDYIDMADTHLFVISNTTYDFAAHEIAQVWKDKFAYTQ